MQRDRRRCSTYIQNLIYWEREVCLEPSIRSFRPVVGFVFLQLVAMVMSGAIGQNLAGGYNATDIPNNDTCKISLTLRLV
jgi:hypothetical protein